METQLPTLLPADNANYLRRPDLERAVWGSLHPGGGVIVSGPRRSGKTSLLYSIYRQAEEDSKHWTNAKSAKALLFDAQVPEPERKLSQLLARLVPSDRLPSDALLLQAGPTADELMMRHVEHLLDLLSATGTEILLFIDEMDLPLQGRSPDLWRHLLDRLFRHRTMRLVATTDALSFDSITQRIEPRRYTRIEMPRWDEREISELIARLPERNRLYEPTRSAISNLLAPAWPIEVMLVLRHLIEDGVPEKSRITFLLDDDEITAYGTALIARVLGRLDRNDARLAIILLEAIVRANAVKAKNIDPERDTKVDNLGKLLPVVRKLVEAGVLAMQGRGIAAATPTMLRAVRLALRL